MDNETQPAIKIDQPKSTNKQRHFLAVFFISFLWGAFGVDRFYLGKVWTGILKLITLGGFGIWVLVDLVLIMSGAMRDKQGNEMLQVARYKRFAGLTVLIFAISLGVIMLITGVSLIYAVTQIITISQNGDLQKLLPGGGSGLPGLDELKGLGL